MPKVSVCVPVYNTARYLRQCLDSLKGQTLTDVEFILVDDGSTDSSGKICDEYAEEDSRFRVFHQKNQGTAVARQLAWNNMTGEFLIVCDSDDWVEPTMYEDMYKAAETAQADMVLCDFFYNYPDGRQVQANNIPRQCDNDNLLRDVLMRRITGSSCTKMVRRQMYFEHNLNWEQGVDLGEDVFMFLKLLQFPMKAVCVPKPYYHYRRAMGSSTLTNSLSLNSFRQAERIHEWKASHIDPKLYGREMFHSSLDYAFIGVRVKDMPVSVYKQFLHRYLPVSDFFRYRILSLKSLLIFFSIVFGLRFAQFIYSLLYKYNYK